MENKNNNNNSTEKMSVLISPSLRKDFEAVWRLQGCNHESEGIRRAIRYFIDNHKPECQEKNSGDTQNEQGRTGTAA